jgi:hypothetical protein
MVGRKKTKRTKRGGEGYEPTTYTPVTFTAQLTLSQLFNMLTNLNHNPLSDTAGKDDIIAAIKRHPTLTASNKSIMIAYLKKLPKEDNFKDLKAGLPDPNPVERLEQTGETGHSKSHSVIENPQYDTSNYKFGSDDYPIIGADEGGKRRRRRHTKKHKKSKKSQKRRGKKTQRRRG